MEKEESCQMKEWQKMMENSIRDIRKLKDILHFGEDETEKLQKANERRRTGGRMTAREIANYFDDVFLQTGGYPTVAAAMKECRASRSTVLRAVQKAGIELPRGRRKKGVRP